MKYIPQTMNTISNTETIGAPCLGPLGPTGYGLCWYSEPWQVTTGNAITLHQRKFQNPRNCRSIVHVWSCRISSTVVTAEIKRLEHGICVFRASFPTSGKS